YENSNDLLFVFDDIDQYLQYLLSNNDKQIILFIADNRNVDHLLHENAKNIKYVYILNSSNEEKSHVVNNSKIRGVFDGVRDFLFQLADEIVYYYRQQAQQFEQQNKHDLAKEKYEKAQQLYGRLVDSYKRLGILNSCFFYSLAQH
ncbi:unnamed protein product, partial [Didymodactylos carnosus]